MVKYNNSYKGLRAGGGGGGGLKGYRDLIALASTEVEVKQRMNQVIRKC